ncbi:hypothetical protein VPH35_137791 [Triticum aestivum]
MPAGVLPDARNLIEGMPSAGDEDYMQNLIFQGGAPAADYDPDETQSQDVRGVFTPAAGYHPDQAAFMRDQVGMDLDGLPLDHEFPDDYEQEEEDECDIEVEPLFEAFQALEAFKVQHNGKCFNLSHCFRVIKDEEKFKAQYAALKSRGGKQAMEEVGDGEPAWPRGKTNSKKEDKRDAASNALIASVEGMMNKKDSREEEERRPFKEEQMNAFMEIQRRRLEMDAEKQAKMLELEAEKQAKMLELEAEKQAKMLEIEAANAKTKAKEVALASMMTGMEIMKVDLNTMSPRKRPWCEKMQADMLKFTDE